VSGVPVDRSRDNGEESGRRQLLALHEMRRGLERRPAEDAAVSGVALTHNTRVCELHELIAALDRRMPREERAGEMAIATAAAALKLRALEQIAELQGDIHAVVRCQTSEHEAATAG